VTDLVDREEIQTTVTEVLEQREPRGFTESVDLAINLRDLNLDDPEQRVDKEILLPNGRGKDVRVGLFCTEEMATKASDEADEVILPEEIEDLADDNNEAKRLAGEMEFFLAEAPLMPQIGRSLGPVLGPRGKMPNPVQPGTDPSETIDSLRRTVRARSEDDRTFHLPAGTENHSEDELTANIRRVIREITMDLERHEHNLDSVFVKTTMGPPVRLI
jgi:large subunit ribosomal protein L1